MAGLRSTVRLETRQSGVSRREINAPVAVATDSRDNLYVANIYDDDVTVYASQGSKPIRTIRHGVSDPYTLVVGN